MINTRRIVICCTAFSLIIFSLGFSATDGLIDSCGEFFVKELLSSGGNDNICIEISKFLFIPFFIFVFNLRKRIFLWEFTSGNIILFSQLLFLSLIDSGSIFKTIEKGNIYLLLWGLCYIALILELYIFFIFERIYKK